MCFVPGRDASRPVFLCLLPQQHLGQVGGAVQYQVRPGLFQLGLFPKAVQHAYGSGPGPPGRLDVDGGVADHQALFYRDLQLAGGQLNGGGVGF